MGPSYRIRRNNTYAYNSWRQFVRPAWNVGTHVQGAMNLWMGGWGYRDLLGDILKLLFS